MVVLDLIARDGLAIDIFTIDTGALPPATPPLIARVRKDYGLAIRTFAPWPDSVDAYIEQYELEWLRPPGEAQAAERAIRFLEPLTRALAKRRAWVTSRRSDAEAALDALHGLWAFSPLAGWSDAQVREYLHAHRVPYTEALPRVRIEALEAA